MSGLQLENLNGSVPYGTVIPSNEDGCQLASQLAGQPVKPTRYTRQLQRSL